MTHKQVWCPICGKKGTSLSGYCREHSPFVGKYKRTPAIREKISKIQKTSPKRVRYYASRKGVKRPEHSEKMKIFWASNPKMRSEAKERGLKMASDKAYLKRLSALLSGEKNHAWRGGISHKKYKGFYQKLKDIIRLRDDFTCQLCGKTEDELEYRLSVNHINFDKEDTREENLNALCKRCNSLINFDRELWTKYFQNKIADINSVGK